MSKIMLKFSNKKCFFIIKQFYDKNKLYTGELLIHILAYGYNYYYVVCGCCCCRRCCYCCCCENIRCLWEIFFENTTYYILEMSYNNNSIGIFILRVKQHPILENVLMEFLKLPTLLPNKCQTDCCKREQKGN